MRSDAPPNLKYEWRFTSVLALCSSACPGAGGECDVGGYRWTMRNYMEHQTQQTVSPAAAVATAVATWLLLCLVVFRLPAADVPKSVTGRLAGTASPEVSLPPARSGTLASSYPISQTRVTYFFSCPTLRCSFSSGLFRSTALDPTAAGRLTRLPRTVACTGRGILARRTACCRMPPTPRLPGLAGYNGNP